MKYLPLSLLSLAVLSIHPHAIATDKPARHDEGAMQARWQKADTDQDGLLSKAEAQAAGMKYLVDNFEALDTNKDGKLSQAEVAAGMRRSGRPPQGQGASVGMPPAQNVNSNPTQNGAPNAPARPYGANNGDAPRPEMAFRSPEQREAAMAERFAKADTNKDGGLSKSELSSAGMQRLLDNFDVIDSNKDGKITPEEIRAAWRRRQ